MSDPTVVPPEEPEIDEELDDEDEEDEDEEEGDETFEVEEILDMKFSNKQLRFETIWVSDHSKTWEPVENFSGGIEHQEIIKFKERNPEKFRAEYSKYQRYKSSEKNQKKQRGRKTWTYVSDDEIRHETPVETATTRETKALFDPNRIEDPDEAFLKTFDTGGRLSRSKTRELRKNINDSANSSPLVSASNSRINSPLPQIKKRGRKPKKVVTSPEPEGPSEQAGSSEPPVPKKKRDTPREKNAEDVDLWVKKRRDVKLNSSDSSDDEDEQPIKRRKKKKVASSSVSRSPTKSPTPQPTTSAAKPTRKRVFEEVKPVTKDPRVVYFDDVNNESDLGEQLSKLGLNVFEGDVGAHFTRREEQRIVTLSVYSLASAVKSRYVDIVELIMINQDPLVSLQTFREDEFPLHLILSDTYKQLKEVDVDDPEMERQIIDNEKLVRVALAYLPIDILSVVDNSKNTLLHCAVHTRQFSLVKYLVDLGSPLHVRNNQNMTALEAAAFFRNVPIVELLLKNGATFHYMVRDYLHFMKGEDLMRHRRYLMETMPENKEMFQKANEIYDMLETTFSETRLPFLRTLNELAHGPIVCMPRGKLSTIGANQSIEFKFPDAHKNCNERTKYMLVVMCMAFNDAEKRFVAHPYSPKMVREPMICDEACSAIKPRHERSMFFNATKAVRRNKQLAAEKERQYWYPIHRDVFRISFDLEHREPLSFVAFQLIRYEFKLTRSRNLPFVSNRY